MVYSILVNRWKGNKLMHYRIIDFHTHAFPEMVEEKAIKHLGRHYRIEIPYRGRIEDLMESAAKINAEKLVIHASATHAGQVENVNNWIASIISSKIIGFGTLHPDYPYVEKELDRIERLGLQGIKLHPEFQQFNIDDPKMFPIYEAISERLPILMHVGDEALEYSSPKKLARVLDKFPKLRVVAAHLGGYAKWDEAKKFLIGRDIFLDTSSTLWRLEPEEAVLLIRNHGVNKVVFGTDYPITSHQEELDRFMALPLTDAEREKILFSNAHRLLKF